MNNPIISPAERECTSCVGVGRVDFELCPTCSGIGRTWLEGGPSFGCRLTLADCRVGDTVTLGSGERGTIVAQHKRGPTTRIAIEDCFGDESLKPTDFPSCVGVSSVVPRHVIEDKNGRHAARQDFSDPLQRQRR